MGKHKFELFLMRLFIVLFMLPIRVGALNYKSDVIFMTNENYNSPSNNYVDNYGNGEYAITQFKINIIVNEDNTFNITEYITAYFNVEKHGIIRKIPLRNKIVRLDGTQSSNRAKISDIKINESSTAQTENGYKILKIGDPNVTITGSKNYIINYFYEMGEYPSKKYDEFYFNLIGNEWDTTISNIEFNIKMPKDFDETKLGFSSGIVGSTENSNVKYDVVDNVISGSYNGVLKVGEALTVRLELPKGYFINTNNNFDFLIIIFFIIPILFVIISFLLWVKYGKDDQVIETIEFYPPEGFNSAEVGFLYKGRANETDVVSLLIYLANKGYIRIEETEEKALFVTKKGFKIVKVKEYDGDNINEKIFLKGLFNAKESNQLSIKKLLKNKNNDQQGTIEDDSYQLKLQEVTAIDLYNNFYVILDAIVNNLNDKKNKYKIFESKTFSKSVGVIVMILISLFTIISIPTLVYGNSSDVITTIVITLFYIPFYAVFFAKGTSVPLLIRCIWGGFTIFHSMLFFMGLPLKDALVDNPILLLGFLIGLVCIIIMIFCLKAMPKRTLYGNEILGKIKGFRTFLETVEKQKLEQLVMEDPTYFYNILPFTYVLGISDKWIKKFETISLKAPDWYIGNTTFNMVDFGNFIDSTLTSVSNAMSSSSDESSGGGSSGGGSGGGGGSSW